MRLAAIVDSFGRLSAKAQVIECLKQAGPNLITLTTFPANHSSTSALRCPLITLPLIPSMTDADAVSVASVVQGLSTPVTDFARTRLYGHVLYLASSASGSK